MPLQHMLPCSLQHPSLINHADARLELRLCNAVSSPALNQLRLHLLQLVSLHARLLHHLNGGRLHFIMRPVHLQCPHLPRGRKWMSEGECGMLAMEDSRRWLLCLPSQLAALCLPSQLAATAATGCSCCCKGKRGREGASEVGEEEGRGNAATHDSPQ